MSRVSLQTDERSNYKQVCTTILGKGEHTKGKNVKNITLQKFVYFFGSICFWRKKNIFYLSNKIAVFFPHSLRFFYSLNQKLEVAQQEPQCSRPVCPPLIAFHVFFMLILYCCRGGLLLLILLQSIWCHSLFLTTFLTAFCVAVYVFYTLRVLLLDTEDNVKNERLYKK